jgi:hypothetical protein
MTPTRDNAPPIHTACSTLIVLAAIAFELHEKLSPVARLVVLSR